MIETTIKSAKNRLKECIKIYLQKDAGGNYLLPQNKQRPIYLEGPAGVGKTEIVRQAAMESGIGFVSYSMTHHNRQSAIGLPAIEEREFDGRTYKVTEYTMSEIVEAVWAEIRRGYKEGILFADEVNCVSETLTAAMLQFLQCKTFGPHAIPEGWIIVTAGNPSAYNKSARAFDAVTRDRLRTIRIKPDREAFLEYATSKGMHPIVIQYVQDHPAEFYHFDTQKGVQQIVTARAWEDLSHAIRAYEANDFPIDEGLVSEFLQYDKTATGFLTYYRTVHALLSREEIQSVLDGNQTPQTAEKLTGYNFQERWAVLICLLAALEYETGKVLEYVRVHDRRYEALKAGKPDASDKQDFKQHTAQLDGQLSAVRSKVDNMLSFIRATLGSAREAEIAINMMLENEAFQELSSYRRLDTLIEIYEEMSRARGEAMRKIQAWSAQNVPT